MRINQRSECLAGSDADSSADMRKRVAAGECHDVDAGVLILQLIARLGQRFVMFLLLRRLFVASVVDVVFFFVVFVVFIRDVIAEGVKVITCLFRHQTDEVLHTGKLVPENFILRPERGAHITFFTQLLGLQPARVGARVGDLDVFHLLRRRFVASRAVGFHQCDALRTARRRHHLDMS